MFGFIFGTLCLIGLVGTLRMARRGGIYGGGCGHHRGHWRRGRVSPESMGRAMGEVIKRRLRIGDDQEPIVDHALADARASMKELNDVLKASRPELAEALRGEKVDDAALDAIFSRQDEAIARARREVVSAARQIHAVLDEGQRKTAADWIAHGDPRWV